MADLISELTTHADHRLSTFTRREVLKALNPLESLFGEDDRNLCESLNVIAPRWDFGYEPGRIFQTLKDGDDQHYIRNSDWDNAALLERCGALECSQARFFALLQRLLHPLARRGEEQSSLATRLNEFLRPDGFGAVVVSHESGHPIYSIQRLRSGVTGAPKNLIFASIGEKPEIVFMDAINNDIRITKYADKCLIYDRPISSAGLSWTEFASWWQETQELSDLASARRALGKRLQQSIEHTRSIPERALFKVYYTEFAPRLGDKLPALIPQVYLHYDPLTIAQRGSNRVLPRQRMDFLLLLDNQVRIVLEVDGKHHYAVGETASPPAYAEMMREDRALRLRGYEVYRFGAADFSDTDVAGTQLRIGDQTRQLIVEFFEKLFRRHGML